MAVEIISCLINTEVIWPGWDSNSNPGFAVRCAVDCALRPEINCIYCQSSELSALHVKLSTVMFLNFRTDGSEQTV